MRAGNGALVFSAFITGASASVAVTALMAETQWKGLHVMFVLLGALVAEKLLGAKLSATHKVFAYGLAAVFHGLLLALLFSFVLLLFPRLSRRASILTLASLAIIDVVFLVLVSPMRELP